MREIRTSGSVRDGARQRPRLLGLRQASPGTGEEKRKEVIEDLKPFTAVQRVQLPPGKGQPASRKRVLHGPRQRWS